ncbi:unnamed protein product [Polarella glacialis]|uniref:Uncharacterized protein n=1 Tax=Polarella glacialis TaxID=89957 RepID=A0A813FQT9_POLGL|nr:unnamed protein product [Polarella glacialis]
MIFANGDDVSEATKYMAAFMDANPDCYQMGSKALPRKRRALQGYNKLAPGMTRPPIAWELVALMALAMCTVCATGVRSALAALTMFVTYCRPGETLKLLQEDLVEPRAAKGHYAVNLHPLTRFEMSKVSLSDETITLDSQEVPWLGEMLVALKTHQPDQKLFNMEYDQLKKDWDQALKAVGLARNWAVLYQLRHAGPSHDMLRRFRSREEAKARGRWASDSSMRRYEAHARVAQEFDKLPDKVKTEAIQATKTLKSAIMKGLRNLDAFRRQGQRRDNRAQDGLP